MLYKCENDCNMVITEISCFISSVYNVANVIYDCEDLIC
jgi:hypothetical protein